VLLAHSLAERFQRSSFVHPGLHAKRMSTAAGWYVKRMFLPALKYGWDSNGSGALINSGDGVESFGKPKHKVWGLAN
jgi:hypothetical protein